MERPQIRMAGPIIDSPDVAGLTGFYQELLGWEVEEIEGPRPGYPPGDGFTRLFPAGGGAELEIQYDENFVAPAWPSVPGGQCKQIHLDFEVDDLESAVAWAKRCGAAEAAEQPTDRNLAHLRVLIDPVGHPFCLFSPATPK